MKNDKQECIHMYIMLEQTNIGYRSKNREKKHIKIYIFGEFIYINPLKFNK